MSKSKKKHATPNFSPAALLRVRLDGLWNNPALPQQAVEQILADLDAVTRNCKPSLSLPVVLAAYQAAPEAARISLAAGLLVWLQIGQHIEALEALANAPTLDHALQQAARQWLAALGRAPVAAAATFDPFYAACEVDDGSQAHVLVIFCTHPKRNRARGLGFLIDYNPPWDGAIKDVMYLPAKSPEFLRKNYVEAESSYGLRMKPKTAPEAKHKILTALTQNRAAQIRLPRDLIDAREPFLRYILSLPDAPGTPAFTSADFDALSQNGQTPEALARLEQTLGRRVRLKDGKELIVMAEPLGGDWDADDDDESN